MAASQAAIACQLRQYRHVHHAASWSSGLCAKLSYLGLQERISVWCDDVVVAADPSSCRLVRCPCRDLAPDVTDAMLQSAFAQFYSSVRSAKVSYLNCGPVSCKVADCMGRWRRCFI